MSPNSKAWISWTKLAFAVRILATIRCSEVTVLPVSVGQTAILPCHNAVHGPVQVVWKDKDLTTLTLNEAVLTDDRRFSVQHKYQNDWDLQITGVRISDTGNYTCCSVVLSGGVCQTLKIVSLVIQIPPTIETISSDVTISTGGSTILVCIATGAPPPTIRWSLHVANADAKELDSTDGIYRIEGAEQSDAGRYECAARNGVPPTAYRSVQVTVTFKPQVSVPYREVRQQLDADTLLECRVRSNPIGDVYWEKNGRRLDSDPGRYRLSSVKIGEDETQILFGLVVYGLRSDDLAQYTCVARNQMGTAVESVLLSVWHNGTLRLLSPPRDAVAWTGQSVVFHCSVEGMTTDDRLIWWRQEPVNASHRTLFDSWTTDRRTWPENDAKTKYAIRAEYNLEIRSVVAEDSGLYHCHVSGLGNFTANLAVITHRSAGGGSVCPPAAETNGVPVTVVIAVVVCIVVVFAVLLVAVVLTIVKHYRKIIDGKRHEQSTNLKTEHKIGSSPTSSYM